MSGQWPPRPHADLVSEAIPLFFIARDSDGFWVARDADGRAGGIFLARRSALHFAKRHSQPFGCATVFLPNRIELDIGNQGNRFAASLAATKRVLAGLVPKALQKLFATVSQTRADVRRNRAAIERDLFRDYARHATKNDDDLPLVQ